MLGKIVLFDEYSNEGKIEGDNKKLYDFHIGEWLSSKHIKLNQNVSYEVEENEARNISPYLPNSQHNIHLNIKILIVE
ncbi:MAG TPA: hypothetical protein EYG85_09795 [Crocinitomix sp.]|nr:hypothetical protein [Crocinitomix sp.]